MHTLNLDPALLHPRIGGRPASLAEVLPGWDAAARLGVVVAHPMAAVGAAALIAAAVARFYQRRQEEGRHAPVYPEIYAFHVGGPHGDLSYFDFLPPRKEVAIPRGRPLALLESLNDRAITHLAVPDGAPVAEAFDWRERNIALERIVAAYAYGEVGTVEGADLLISLDPDLDDLACGVVRPAGLLVDWDPEATQGTARAPQGDGSARREWLASVRRRMTETSEASRLAAELAYEARRRDGRVEQGFRRITTKAALGRIAALVGNDGAPAEVSER